MDPLDFLELAEQFKTSSAEAERRTAIGRSYYALYNLLVTSLAAEDVPFQKNADDHSRLLYYLNNCGQRPASKIAGQLNNLRRSRNSADYDMDFHVDQNQSELAFGRAQQSTDEYRGMDVKKLAESIRFLPRFESTKQTR